MSHRWESGFVVRTPAWHNLAPVLPDWPGSWAEVRKEAGLDWDIETRPVYDYDEFADMGTIIRVPGYQMLTRSDKERGEPDRVLTIQPESYAVISIAELGEVVSYVLDQEDYGVRFETAGSLYGGRLIFATVYFEEPLKIPGDPSETYLYVAFMIRNDGQGGLRAFPTNVRIVCWNTASAADLIAAQAGLGVTIRHTKNWADRTQEMRELVRLARNAAEHWEHLAAKLSMVKINRTRRETFLRRFIPIADDMSLLMQNNRRESRQQIRSFLGSASCAGVEDNLYGLLMAATEYVDHGRPFQTQDSYVSRTLLRPEPDKKRAISVARGMARMT